MNVRNARPEELDEIMDIYERARLFMCENGNPTQWWEGYPPRELIQDDIEQKKLYVCEDGGEIAAVFYFAVENDPTYEKIYGGAWLNGNDYAVMHRVAVAKKGKGVIAHCFEYCLNICPDLKIDTHKDNISMKTFLKKNKFTYCGH
jgi:hypothetical protein